MNAVNRLGGLLLGIVLLAAGAVTIVETVALWAWHRSWPLPVTRWREHLSAVQWSDWRVLATSIIVLVAGLLVLVAELWRRRPTHVATSLNTDDETWVVHRSSVERQVAGAAGGIRGVDGVRATASGKEDRWQLAVAATTVGNVVDPDDVQQVVRSELRHLGSAEDVPVNVTVRRSASRS